MGVLTDQNYPEVSQNLACHAEQQNRLTAPQIRKSPEEDGTKKTCRHESVIALLYTHIEPHSPVRTGPHRQPAETGMKKTANKPSPT